MIEGISDQLVALYAAGAVAGFIFCMVLYRDKSFVVRTPFSILFGAMWPAMIVIYGLLALTGNWNT